MRDDVHRSRRTVLQWCVIVTCSLPAFGQQHASHGPGGMTVCRRAVVEGTVREGQGFQQMFAHGLVVGLEPIPSGWAVRVVVAGKPRSAHDLAEIATLPYVSVSPLLLSTDWAFRAQDAVGWTPRRFHYAASEVAYAQLAGLYDAVLHGDERRSEYAAMLAEQQPEAVLEILDARLAPGLADQTRMAASLAVHFADTPHTIDTAAHPSALGRIEDLRFRITLDLPPGLVTVSGVPVSAMPCLPRPTAESTSASQTTSKHR